MDKMRGMGGLSKMGNETEKTPKPKMAEKEPPAGKPDEGGGETKTHTVTEHPDGHMTSAMHGGEPMEHPDHMHLLAHMGHQMTGGDKHHIVHHDGMQAHSHSIGEDGQHSETQDHNSADEAKSALDQFLGEEAQEPQHQGGALEQAAAPAYGGM